MDLARLAERLDALWKQAVAVWIAGGWSMIFIALTAMIMFGFGLSIYFRLTFKGFTFISEKTWRRWILEPQQRRGAIGELIHFVMGNRTLSDMSSAFTELRATEIAPFERDLRVMRVCISIAPLLGLLGTVTGMLVTFQALASGSGGEKTMGLIAKGISEALITTETGLVVALPGLFFQYQLSRKFDRYKAFLSHLETVCTQFLYRELKQSSEKHAAAQSTVAA